MLEFFDFSYNTIYFSYKYDAAYGDAARGFPETPSKDIFRESGRYERFCLNFIQIIDYFLINRKNAEKNAAGSCFFVCLPIFRWGKILPI